MEWPLLLILLVGGFIVLMLSGLPVAFGFMIINFIGAYFFMGGVKGLEVLIHSVFGSVAMFSLVPVPLFVLMGEVMFQSGMAPRMIDALDKWLGRLPGRLALEAVAGGVIFATLSGSSIAGVAMLGTTIMPDMERRGYKKPMTIGPILGCGGLAMMIPPSLLGVLLGSIGGISIAKILIAIIIPGLLLALLYSAYIIIRCRLQPSIAPVYETGYIPLSKKLIDFAKYILPLGFIILLVTGIIFLGWATPTEASATGALGCFILAAAYRKLDWAMAKRALSSTTRITGMMFMIIGGALAFSQLLAFTGASRGLLELAVGLAVSPIVVIIFMMVLVLVLGTFMDVVAIMMITLPIFMPIILALGYDPVWFAVLLLINIEVGFISPPFGISLFVMKGVATKGTTMTDIYKSAVPFIALLLLALILVIVFPALALWLVGLMR
ncbi:TRAP transporter large permease subunit [Chloroflexota bacterium]